MSSRVLAYCFLLLAAWPTHGTSEVGAAEPSPLRIYVDADRTTTLAATESIELGLRVALDEVGQRIGGRRVEVISLDHRSNNGRSRRNLERALADPFTLAVFCGLHSPPVLAHRDWINEHQLLLLDAWAAAGPITRAAGEENWIFRLSVDDSKAGYAIAQYALNERGFLRPGLLLEDTGWGHSNDATMRRALLEWGVEAQGLRWFHWGLSEDTARMRIRELKAAGSDCIFLVANVPEAKTIVRAMASLPAEERLPICSHWGLTGGDFETSLDLAVRESVDLAFLQTSYSLVEQVDDPRSRSVWERARRLASPPLSDPEELAAPLGFVHAYDLTRILLAACDQAGVDGEIADVRARVRDALEHLEVPVVGLIRVYDRPFGAWSEANPDAHEALGLDDLRMARYSRRGIIRLEAR